MKKHWMNQYAPDCWAWRNLELSHFHVPAGGKTFMSKWILAWNGSNKKLPCGKESMEFYSLSEAGNYLINWSLPLPKIRPFF